MDNENYTLSKEEADYVKKLAYEGLRDDQIKNELQNYFGGKFTPDVMNQISEISKTVNEELNIPLHNPVQLNEKFEMFGYSYDGKSFNSFLEAKQWIEKNPDYRITSDKGKVYVTHKEDKGQEIKKEKLEQKINPQYEKIDWNKIKATVSILQVANDLGYKPVAEKTTSLRPVLRNPSGDTIIIKNPTDFSRQQYYNPNDFNDKGSVIDFVQNRLNQFNQIGKNETDKLNNVLKHYSGTAFDINSLAEKIKISKPREFDINNFPHHPAELKDLFYLNKERNISNDTINSFLPFIHMVKNNNYMNIGFPYSIPGEDKIRGYELRNYGFKSFTEGGDKVMAVWQASFAPDKSMVRNIYVSESAIDAMSFFELNKGKVDLNKAVFVSTGGTLLYSQVQNLKNEYPNAKFHGCFDKDIAGNLYDITLACAVEGKTANKISKGDTIEFRVNDKTFEMKKDEVSLKNFMDKAGFSSTQVESHKPLNGKDFNEVLSKKNERNPTQKPYNFKR